MKIPKYDKHDDDPYSVESYRRQAPCWLPLVKETNIQARIDARERGETPPEPEYRPTRPAIICNCGNPVGLRNHSISADGQVTASFYHKKGTGRFEDPAGCEWHVYIELEGYDGRPWPRNPDGEE